MNAHQVITVIRELLNRQTDRLTPINAELGISVPLIPIKKLSAKLVIISQMLDRLAALYAQLDLFARLLGQLLPQLPHAPLVISAMLRE